MVLKLTAEAADRVFMVVLQPFVIALTMSLVIWALRVLEEVERAEA